MKEEEVAQRKALLQSKLQEEQLLASWVTTKFNNSLNANTSRRKLDKMCLEAYYGDYYKNKSNPDYKSNHVSNFIFSTIETIKPIMTDNNPRFQAIAKNPTGSENIEKIQMLMDYEFDREKMRDKIPQIVLTSLQIGTGIAGVFWDKKKNNVKVTPINPFNIFPDPMATCVDDSEYIIYATYHNINKIKEMFPNKASFLEGGDVDNTDLVGFKQKPQEKVDNQILILECWCRDYTYIDIEENGIVKQKRKFPKGRVITVAPQFGVVLSDKSNPYKDGKFPFIFFKDYDIPFEIFGRGEVEQLLAPQNSINELSNQIIDNAKHVANTIWVIDKNSGIGKGQLSNRPGLVVRKNPGTSVERPAPPPMPMFVQQKVEEMKRDMETIAGIHDVTQGQTSAGVTAAQAIMALQEAGQARIRLKVRLLESSLSELANMWYSRIQQFWNDERMIRIADVNGAATTSSVLPEEIEEDYDLVITAGSTMPLNKNAMLDMMIRLAQTPAEDGMPMIDRQALMEFVPVNNKQKLIERFDSLKQQAQGGEQAKLQQYVEQMSQVIQELTKEVQSIEQEFEQIKRKGELDKAHQKGIQKGLAPQNLTPQEQYGIMNEDEKKIPDDILMDIMNLPDEEIQQLMKVFPNLDEIIKQNS